MDAVVSSVPLIVRSPLAAKAPPRVYVPETVIAAKLCAAASVIVFAVPVNETVEPVAVKEVADEVFQVPATPSVDEPNARVAGPDDVRSDAKDAVPPVRTNVPVQVTAEAKVVLTPAFTVMLLRVCGTFTDPPEAPTTIVDVPAVKAPRWVSIEMIVIVLPFAVRAPFATTVTLTALMARPEALVFKVVTAAPPPTVKVPATTIPRVDRVNVAAEAPELNVTLLNSLPARLAPAKVIVWDADALNTIVPVPGLQDPEVLASVQLPETVHVSDPKAMEDAAADTFTFPEIVTLPEVEVRAPPDRRRLPAVRVEVDFAKVPPERVSAFPAVMLVPAVTVPELTVRL